MSVFEINKIVGAVLSAGLVAMVVGIIGDALVSPKHHGAAAVSVPEGPAAGPAAEPEKEVPFPQLLASADPKDGAKVFNKCKSCHDASKGGKNKIGPNLWNVVGSDKATHPGFNYSGALKDLAGNWTYEDLNTFLKNPKAFAKGTKMTFAGISKAAERASVIAYLRSLSDSPKPLP